MNNIVSSAVQSAGCTLIKIFGINQIFVKFKIQIVHMSHIYESRWTWEFDFDAVRWCFIDRCMYTVQTKVQRSFENSFFELTDNLTFLQQKMAEKLIEMHQSGIDCDPIETNWQMSFAEVFKIFPWDFSNFKREKQ